VERGFVIVVESEEEIEEGTEGKVVEGAVVREEEEEAGVMVGLVTEVFDCTLFARGEVERGPLEHKEEAREVGVEAERMAEGEAEEGEEGVGATGPLNVRGTGVMLWYLFCFFKLSK
jgi:hypothetical protein